MNIRIRKILCILISVTFLVTSCIAPPSVEAKASFNRFNRVTRRVFRKINKGTKFIINLPDKSTRWMGPVLGPIASTVLTGNITNSARWSNVFDKVQRINKGLDTIDDIEKKQQYLQDLRNAYRDQSTDLRKQAEDIRNSRRDLLDQLANGDITYDEYRNHVVAINDVADVYEATADKFDNAANRMRPEDIGGILSRNLLNTIWGEVRNAVVYETSREINRLIDPNVIQRLVNDEGVNLDILIDAFAASQIEKHLGEGEKINTEELKNRVRDKIKDILRENKEDWKNNWQSKIDELINETKKELDEEKNKLPEVNTTKPSNNTKSEENTGESDELIYSDQDPTNKCNSGYEWDIKIGKCVQKNCNPESIPNAHYSYVKDCVCGSSGSINEKPDDPNKRCAYPASYKSCPGCVYACVGIHDECPGY